MRTGRKTDSGFTLIEIIVVIAIIAVLTGIFIISINPIQANASRRAAVNMRDVLLQGKQYAMTRGNSGTYVEITSGDQITATFYVNGEKADSETISSRKVNVSYNDGTSPLTGDTLYLAFDKGSGACRVFRTGTSYNSSDTIPDSSKAPYIRISAGGVTYEVKVSGLTGRVDMQRI